MRPLSIRRMSSSTTRCFLSNRTCLIMYKVITETRWCGQGLFKGGDGRSNHCGGELAPARVRSTRKILNQNSDFGAAAQPSGSKLPRHKAELTLFETINHHGQQQDRTANHL